MRRLLLALVIAVVACSGDDDDDTPDVDAAPVPTVVTMTLESFTLQPGEEVWMCQTFANPFGADAEIVKWHSEMTAGAHHMLVFFADDATNTAAAPCEGGGGMFSALVYDAQARVEETTYPAGVAMLVPAAQGFRTEAHYLNETDAPITAQISINFTLATPGQVTAHAGQIFFGNSDFVIPPGETVTASLDCPIDREISLVSLTGHMHRHGVGFRALVDGEVVYETDQFAEPPRGIFDPARTVAAGSTITFACTWTNTTQQPLVFGDSAATNEMCGLFGAFYPVPPGMDPILQCLAGDGGTMGDCDALEECACTGAAAACPTECATTVCMMTQPDDACLACLEASCAAELETCTGGGG